MGPALPEDAEEWMDGATETDGNWRNHWVEWLQSHSKLSDPPKRMGSKQYPTMEAAPGIYVTEH